MLSGEHLPKTSYNERDCLSQRPRRMAGSQASAVEMGQLADELQVADSDVRGPHLPHLPICLGDRIVHRHRPDGAPDKRGMVLEVSD